VHPAGLAVRNIHFLDPVVIKKQFGLSITKMFVAIGKPFLLLVNLIVERVIALAGPSG